MLPGVTDEGDEEVFNFECGRRQVLSGHRGTTVTWSLFKCRLDLVLGMLRVPFRFFFDSELWN